MRARGYSVAARIPDFYAAGGRSRGLREAPGLNSTPRIDADHGLIGAPAA